MAFCSRSLLFVPVISRFLNHLNELSADAVIFDLEDSIPEDQKQAALGLLSFFLENNTLSCPCFVRVNQDHIDRELTILASFRIDGFMFPKMENVDFLIPYRNLLLDKKNIALVETPKGLVRLEQIAESDYIDALALGAEDLTCISNIKNSPEVLAPIRTRLVLFARAFQKKVYDTPSLNYKDYSLLEREIQMAIDFGFDGKLAIHPGQVPFINKMFHCNDYDNIHRIIERFRQQGGGVLEFEGQLYERPHIERLQRIMEEAEHDQ